MKYKEPNNQIINFLKSKPGYLKEGGKRLRHHLLKRGITSTVDECKEAIRIVNKIYSTYTPKANKPINNSKILIYDIETSYNIVKSWRVGYNLNINPSDILHERSIICVSYKWLDDDKTYNIQWSEDQCDKQLIKDFIKILNEADLIVAHNGDRYDLKFIKTRAIKHGLEMLIDYPQFDTLKVAKKKFAFNSNKLDYISEFLGFDNKIKTTMKLWDDIILKQCPDAMSEMIKYCDMDVELLEKVYKKLVFWEKPKLHQGVLDGKDKNTSPINGGTNLKLIKTVTTNRGTKKKIMKDLDNGRMFEMSETSYNKYIKR